MGTAAARARLVALIVAATAALVVGTAIERGSGGSEHHEAAGQVARPPSSGAGGTEQTHAEGGGESASARATEAGAGSSQSPGEQSHAELRPLGIDIEAWPFVTLAALGSLALAVAVWLAPELAALLALVAVTMLAFAALDVRELVHQLDVSKDGLAALAAGIGLLHGAAALVAATGTRRRVRRSP